MNFIEVVVKFSCYIKKYRSYYIVNTNILLTHQGQISTLMRTGNNDLAWSLDLNKPKFKSWCSYVVALFSWENYLTCPSFRCLLHKIDIFTIATSLNCNKDISYYHKQIALGLALRQP